MDGLTRGYSLVCACDLELCEKGNSSQGDLGFSDSSDSMQWLCLSCGARSSDASLRLGKSLTGQCRPLLVSLDFTAPRDRLASLPLRYRLECNGATSHRTHVLAMRASVLPALWLARPCVPEGLITTMQETSGQCQSG